MRVSHNGTCTSDVTVTGHGLAKGQAGYTRSASPAAQVCVVAPAARFSESETL